MTKDKAIDAVDAIITGNLKGYYDRDAALDAIRNTPPEELVASNALGRAVAFENERQDIYEKPDISDRTMADYKALGNAMGLVMIVAERVPAKEREKYLDNERVAGRHTPPKSFEEIDADILKQITQAREFHERLFGATATGVGIPKKPATPDLPS